MITEGDLAPSFTLPSSDDRMVSVEDFRGEWLVLYFYPKDLTPGCTTEACDFRDRHAEFALDDVAVIGVSPDPIAKHARFIEKFGLPFPLLSDESHEMLEAYGVWKEKSLYGRKFMGVERTTMVIDPDGRIAKIFTKVKVRGHADDVLHFVEEAKVH